MKLTHRRDNAEEVIAREVQLADGFFEQRLGLMGRSPLQEGQAMVFRFDMAKDRYIHTMFVRGAIDIIWIENEQVTAIETMRPWRFGTSARADTIVELPGEKASSVAVGDIVRLDRD